METQGKVLDQEVGKSHAADSNYRFFFNLVISNFVLDLQRMSFEIIMRFPLDTYFSSLNNGK